MQCAFCGNSINRRLDKKSLNHFCSSSCAARYNNKLYPRKANKSSYNCPICNKTFERSLYEYNRNISADRINCCSRRCARYAHLGYLPPAKICKGCGAVLDRIKYSYCSTCRGINAERGLEVTIGEIKELYKSKSSMAVAAKIRGYGKTIYNNSDGPKYCVICGYNKHYEVCHIRAVSSFSDNTKMREIHDLSNLVALCPNCHWEYDRGLLNLSSILS